MMFGPASSMLHSICSCSFMRRLASFEGGEMRALYQLAVASVAISLGIVVLAAQGPAPAAGARGQGGGRGGPANAAAIAAATPNPANGGLIGGSILPDKPDARGWGWQVKALMNPATL